MKLYTLYTDSHKDLLLNHFLPSISQNTSPFDIVLRKIPQYCKSGEYMKIGWIETMIKKVEYHIESCLENLNKSFIYTDCDVQFLTNDNIIDIMLNELEGYDIACQDDAHPFGDRTTYCAGFFICKSNTSTVALFEKILQDMKRNSAWLHDQEALNMNLSMVKHKTLSHRFFTHAQITKELWSGNNDDFVIPKNILVHHANWTHGVDNKIKLLNMVKTQYENFNHGT